MSTSNGASAAGLRASDDVGRGMLLTLGAVITFGIQDAAAKILMQDFSAFQITMMRFWAFAAFSLIIVSRQAPLRQALASRAMGWQVLRGLLLVADIWLYALAIRTVPLAELQAISLVYPLLVTLFAIPVLGEKVGVFRLSAVGVGFLGALLIVRPGGLTLDWGVGFALLSSTSYAVYIVVTRKVSAVDSSSTSMVYAGLVGLLLTSAVGVFFWEPLSWGALALAGVVMVTTCLGHGAMILAMSYAPASVVQPLTYFSLPWAIVLSLVVFQHLIDPIGFVGAVIIVGAGLVVMARERRKAAQKLAEPGLPGKE